MGKHSPDPVSMISQGWCPPGTGDTRTAEVCAARAGGRHGLHQDPGAQPGPSPDLSCPLSLAPSHAWRKTLRKVRGAKGAWRRRRGQQSSPQSPRVPFLLGGKTAETAFEPWLCPAVSPSAATAPGDLGKPLHGIGNSARAGWDLLREWDLPVLQVPPS